MIRKIIRIDEEKCSGCGRLRVRLPRRGHRHGERQGEAPPGGLLRRAGGTACRPARRTPSPLRSGRPPPTTRRRCWPPKPRRQRRIPAAAPVPGGRSFARPDAAQPEGGDPLGTPAVAGPAPPRPPPKPPISTGADLLIAADCSASLLRRLPPGTSSVGRADPHRLPQARPGGLQRKTRRNLPPERHPSGFRRPDGGALLRRPDPCRPEGSRRLRQGHPPLGHHPLDRRQNPPPGVSAAIGTVSDFCIDVRHQKFRVKTLFKGFARIQGAELLGRRSLPVLPKSFTAALPETKRAQHLNHA